MLKLLLSTLSTPRVAIGQILRLDLSSTDVLRAAVFVSCASGVLSYALSFFLLQAEPEQFQEPGSPFVSAFVNFVLIYVVAALIDRVGTLFGGAGDFDGAVRVSIWSSLVGMIAIAASLTTLFLTPQLGLLSLTAFSAWSFVLLAIFIQELHGFRSLAVTIAGMFGLALIMLVALSTLAVMLGLVPEVS